jgi:hypothetical protein
MNWWDKEIPAELADVIIQLKVKINNQIVNRDWRKDCKIEYDHLEDDLESMPGIFAFWSSVLAEARKNLRIAEYQIDIRKSKILREMKIPEGVKLTVSDKENIVNLDKEYNELKAKFIELECTVSKLFGIVDSLKMKSDNLRSLAGFKREELKNN